MIVVAGTVKVRPEQREAAVALAAWMSQQSEAEAGCLRYRFYSDINDANTFFIFEEWESEEALAHHFQTDHMARFQEQLPALVAGEMAIKRYGVTAVSDM